jgi:hypothetical protein
VVVVRDVVGEIGADFGWRIIGWSVGRLFGSLLQKLGSDIGVIYR